MSNIMPTFPVELSDIIEDNFWGYFGTFYLASPKFLHLDVIGGQIKLLREPASSYIQPCASPQTCACPQNSNFATIAMILKTELHLL